MIVITVLTRVREQVKLGVANCDQRTYLSHNFVLLVLKLVLKGSQRSYDFSTGNFPLRPHKN